jgi:hypothetical protein
MRLINLWGGEMFPPATGVRVQISRQVLDSVFDDCDRFAQDETGGKILGTFTQTGDGFDINVSGVIDAGPQTARSQTSLFQDGEYQARIFRALESEHPEIEHLGTWHSHHVNGYPHLSGGDIETYQRTVNHAYHHPPLFYALLVVAKTKGKARYKVKHYVLFKGNSTVYEIPPRGIRVVETPAVWTPSSRTNVEEKHEEAHGSKPLVEHELAGNQRVLAQLFPGMQPLFSKAADTLYWSGVIETVDGNSVRVRILPLEEDGKAGFVASVTDPKADRRLRTDVYRTAWEAGNELERRLNRLIYKEHVA